MLYNNFSECSTFAILILMDRKKSTKTNSQAHYELLLEIMGDQVNYKFLERL